jgi:hypothetical protein
MRFQALYLTNVQLESIACFVVAPMTTPLQQGLSSPQSVVVDDRSAPQHSPHVYDIASAERGGHHIAAATCGCFKILSAFPKCQRSKGIRKSWMVNIWMKQLYYPKVKQLLLRAAGLLYLVQRKPDDMQKRLCSFQR